MNNWKTILYFVGAFFFVLFSVLIGRFLLPFITWCTSVEVVIVLSVITAAGCIAGMVVAWRKRSKVKVVAAIAVPIFLSAGLNTLWFGLRTDYRLYAWDDYLAVDYNNGFVIYTKFGTTFIHGNWGYLLAYTDCGDKVICCWDYDRDRDYESKYDYRFKWYCNVYDTDGTLLENFRGTHYDESRWDPRIWVPVVEKLRSEDYVVPGY